MRAQTIKQAEGGSSFQILIMESVIQVFERVVAEVFATLKEVQGKASIFQNSIRDLELSTRELKVLA